jgi:hypothetical protein
VADDVPAIARLGQICADVVLTSAGCSTFPQRSARCECQWSREEREELSRDRIPAACGVSPGQGLALSLVAAMESGGATQLGNFRWVGLMRCAPWF